MIYTNVENMKEHIISERIATCFGYAKIHDLHHVELGRYEINEHIYVNIVSYETKDRDACFFEAHRDYIDIHMMLDGSECIDINNIDSMKQEEYQKELDFLPVFGGTTSTILMSNDDVLICYPHDAHRTAIKVGKAKQIKKAIFKVKI